MKERLQAIIDELNAREMRAISRADKKRELGNPIEASKQDGKFIAYRYAKELVEELFYDLCDDGGEEDYDDWAEYEDRADEVGYDPYSGCYCDDL
jgi:hypothetical protein